MIRTNQCPVCKTPDLCVIACPYNRILAELFQPSSEPPAPWPDDDKLEIVFGERSVDKESP